MKQPIQEEIRGVFAFVGVLWGVYLLDWVLPWSFSDWGLVPRTAWGLIGIPLAPLLHADLGHLIGNSIPLVILLILMAGSRTETWSTVGEIILLGGSLLWLFGRSAVHIGASSLVYGLIVFLVVSGFRERRLVPMLVAIIVGFLYGGTVIFGVLPSVGSHISWDGHLCGAIAGGALGYFQSREPKGETITDSGELQ